MKTFAELAGEMEALDNLLKPVANRPIDLHDPNWLAKMAARSPLDTAGIRGRAEGAVADALAAYVAGTESEREALRELFRKHGAFAWAAAPRELLASEAGLRARLLLLSLQDQGADSRDTIVAIDVLVGKAKECGVDIQPLLAEAAALSSTRNRYGMGSMRDLLLKAFGRR